MRPMHTHRYVERLVDLLDPSLNRLHNVDLDEARRRVLTGDPAAVRAIDGSFAIVVKDGITIRMARSLDRPMRYFLAKRQEGPALFVADRIDTFEPPVPIEGFKIAMVWHERTHGHPARAWLRDQLAAYCAIH